MPQRGTTSAVTALPVAWRTSGTKLIVSTRIVASIATTTSPDESLNATSDGAAGSARHCRSRHWSHVAHTLACTRVRAHRASAHSHVDGRTDRRTDGRKDGRADRRTGGQTDGRTERNGHTCLKSIPRSKSHAMSEWSCAPETITENARPIASAEIGRACPTSLQHHIAAVEASSHTHAHTRTRTHARTHAHTHNTHNTHAHAHTHRCRSRSSPSSAAFFGRASRIVHSTPSSPPVTSHRPSSEIAHLRLQCVVLCCNVSRRVATCCTACAN
jgi:hypothetical protein